MSLPFTYAPPTGPLKIIHEDDQLLVLDKPSGLLSVPGRPTEHKDCLETRVQAQFPDALTVHRLDMSTSGICIMAKTKSAQRHLGLQFEKRYTSKTYIARVEGLIDADAGEIDLPLICDWPNRPKQKVCYESGKPALTRWKVIAREIDATRVALTPITGRSHQLRVHMQQLGHPILGDELYATPAGINAANRLQLHAETLIIHHPIGGERIEFKADCPF